MPINRYVCCFIMCIGVVKNEVGLVGDLLLSVSALCCPRQHRYVPGGTLAAVNVFHRVNTVTTVHTMGDSLYDLTTFGAAVNVGRHGWPLMGHVVSMRDSEGS